MNTRYSVLMSVYQKEVPEYFRESVESMLNQTIPPDEIIIVKDGPLGDSLNKVADDFKDNTTVRFISLEENQGLGVALKKGLMHCRNEYVARMDTDDISHSDRCEKQLKYFHENPNISVVGAYISEFIGNPENIVSYRKVPLTDKHIKKQMKTRNAFNHVSVMFRKSYVIKSGSYQHFYFNEDYYLWIRMQLQNCRFANINESLVKVRIDKNTFFRRGGWKYFTNQKRLLQYMLQHKLIGRGLYMRSNLINFTVRVLMPNEIRKMVYLRFLRKQL